MPPTRSRLALAAAALAFAGALALAFRPRAVEVEVRTVSRGPLRVTVDADGRTRLRERYVVAAPVAGRLLRVEVHPGDPVRAGTTRLTALEPTDPALLDPRARAEAEARLQAAEAARQRAATEVERARAAAGLAATDRDRARQLAATGAIPAQELDAAVLQETTAAEALRAAAYAVQIAAYEADLARATLRPEDRPGSAARVELRSPIDGQVLRVFQESSTPVAAGTRILELGNPADLEVEVDVLSSDAVRIRPGARMILEHWGGDTPLEARVRLVEPSGFLKVSALGVEEQRVNVIADLTDPPARRAGLGDAFRVEARIVTWESPGVPKVPVAALFRAGPDWAVFVVAEGRARLRPVELGQRNDEEAEVRQGLAPGEAVIVHPGDRVRPGSRVRPSPAGT